MATETRFAGVRVHYQSTKTPADLLAALLADIGEQPVPITEIGTACGDWDSYREEVEKYVGPSGFMLFALLDHGGWIGKAGIGRSVIRVILGNPLIAITMLRHDVTAGLFVPVELLIVDTEDGGSSLTYVRPSSLMLTEPNPGLQTAAEALDDKLAALAEKVTS
ncbi:DUF302 domain-containing protein [Mycobacterium sp. shizuoka-1]|uniref:DUF302 domain-containing protein n=1 Tax=Mycobacterium sp. shizuoka-1 TaxID=2039281 RepID=UPI000C0661CB|nr:DUF302 domain-containing protein [Mycobacterium sp. shizuoka-1]GAY13842.1 hypothetical protein MSZK_05680 [Mycobacterium sp. shizuoka-1]